MIAEWSSYEMPTSDLSGWALVLLLKTSAVVLLAAGTTRWLLRTASQKRLLWVLTFATVLVMPAGEWLLPPVALPLVSVPHEVFARTVGSGDATISVAGLALVLWLSGSAVAALRAFNDWRAARALLARSMPVDPDTLPACARQLVRGASPTPVRLAYTDELVTAAVIGWRAPTVLLPRAALAWRPDMLRAALVHEIEHVTQRDWLVMLFERVTLALYWPNPLLWMARRAATMAREIAADDAVIRAGIAPSAYARQLLALSRTRPRHAGPQLVVGLGSGVVRPRVHALFAGDGRHDAARRGARRTMIAATLVLALPAFAVRPLTCIPTNALSGVLQGR
jgi:beta-lactamase regulating signal transducer with metallopeptidase domain